MESSFWAQLRVVTIGCFAVGAVCAMSEVLACNLVEARLERVRSGNNKAVPSFGSEALRVFALSDAPLILIAILVAGASPLVLLVAPFAYLGRLIWLKGDWPMLGRILQIVPMGIWAYIPLVGVIARPLWRLVS